MIKETLTLFLAHQQQTLEHEESLAYNNESLGQTQNEQQSEIIVKSEAERELHAVQIVQVYTSTVLQCLRENGLSKYISI
jgi:hypothetical protein